MKILLIIFIFFPFLSVFAAEENIQFPSDRFEVIYKQAQSLYYKKDYKKAFSSALDYVDRTSWYGCKGYDLIKKINEKQGINTNNIDAVIDVCYQTSNRKLNKDNILKQKDFLKTKDSLTLFDVLLLHFISIPRDRNIKFSEEEKNEFYALFDKINKSNKDSLPITSSLTPMFFSSIVEDMNKKMSYVDSLKDEDFYLKPTFNLLVMYSRGRTINGYLNVLKYDNVSYRTDSYQGAYKNLSLLYFKAEKYDLYLKYLKKYHELPESDGGLKVGFWYLAENIKLLENNKDKFLPEIKNIFGDEYARFLENYYFFSSRKSVLNSSLVDSKIYSELYPRTLEIIYYYSKNKNTFVSAFSNLSPRMNTSRKEYGLTFSDEVIGAPKDPFISFLIPDILKRIYYLDKDKTNPFPQDFPSKLVSYKDLFPGFTISENTFVYTGTDRPYPEPSVFEIQNQTGSGIPPFISGSLMNIGTGNTLESVQQDYTFAKRFAISFLFLSLFSFFGLLFLFFKKSK